MEIQTQRTVGRTMWDELREQHGNIHITMCKIDGGGNLLCELNTVLCDNLEGWEVGGVSEVYLWWGGAGNRGIPVAESC